MNSFERGLQKLLLGQLSELLYCERQSAYALGVMTGAAENDDLREVLRAHERATVEHARELDVCFTTLGATPMAYPCRATQGLVDDVVRMAQELPADVVRDHALIAAARRLEVFAMASYANAARMARHLAQPVVLGTITGILQEKHAEHEALDLVVDQLSMRRPGPKDATIAGAA